MNETTINKVLDIFKKYNVSAEDSSFILEKLSEFVSRGKENTTTVVQNKIYSQKATSRNQTVFDGEFYRSLYFITAFFTVVLLILLITLSLFR